MKKDFAQRVGETINELDIDFSRFTPLGWLISLLSLGAGGAAGWFASQAVPRKPDAGPALAFGVTMIAVTVVSFIAMRWMGDRVGIRSIKPSAISKGGPE